MVSSPVPPSKMSLLLSLTPVSPVSLTATRLETNTPESKMESLYRQWQYESYVCY
jgi:hypothetical protein